MENAKRNWRETYKRLTENYKERIKNLAERLRKYRVVMYRNQLQLPDNWREKYKSKFIGVTKGRQKDIKEATTGKDKLTKKEGYEFHHHYEKGVGTFIVQIPTELHHHQPHIGSVGFKNQLNRLSKIEEKKQIYENKQKIKELLTDTKTKLKKSKKKQIRKEKSIVKK